MHYRTIGKVAELSSRYEVYIEHPDKLLDDGFKITDDAQSLSNRLLAGIATSVAM